MAQNTTRATIPSDNPGHAYLLFLHPIASNGAEDAEHERVVERLDLMRHARLDVQQFTVSKRHFVAGDEQLQRALQDVGHLLAVVRVLRHDGAPLQVNLRDRLPLSRHEFPGNHLGDFLERDFVPAKQTIGLQFCSLSEEFYRLRRRPWDAIIHPEPMYNLLFRLR